MKTRFLLCSCAIAIVTALTPPQVRAHSWKADGADHRVVFDEAYRAAMLAEFVGEQDRQAKPAGAFPAQFLTAANATGPAALQFAALAVAASRSAPQQAAPFLAFAPKVNARWDKDFLYIESNGLPDHNMMVGITAWQQQVPLPQSYSGDNAWRIPLHPVPAAKPAMIKGRFLRGAIALAVNGIPIFNPQNNRGEISQEIGELDQWGGHCGRADDYHYHNAPLHLQEIVGKGQPVAYALDGYPIYGLAEPDGTPTGGLDECRGHDVAGAGYHYHAATKYPYVIGGFHGEVVEGGGQVDPQPRAQPVREALPALRSARITAFESTGTNGYKLSYTVNGDPRSVSYTLNPDGSYPFAFDNGRDGKTSQIYTRRASGGGRGPGGGGGKGGPGKREMRVADNPPPSAGEERRPQRPQIAASVLDRNGDGTVSAEEFADDAKRRFASRPGGETLAVTMEKARADFNRLDRNQDGKLDRLELAAVEAPPAGNAPARGGDEPPRRERDQRGAGGGGRTTAAPAQPRSSNGTFLLTSTEVEDGAEMPRDYTGDGSGATLPLQWKGAPAGTQEYALIMDHMDPEGVMKWYWTLYDLPANATGLPKNVQGMGKVGTGFKGQIGYEPPHSKGPGAKTYVLTLYALSAPLQIRQSPREVNREVLLAAMQGKVLASSSLHVVHTSSGNASPGDAGQRPPQRREAGPGDRPGNAQPAAANDPAPSPPSQGAPPATQGAARPGGPGGKGGKGGGKGGPDNKGLIKPSMADTMKVNVYADNWFILYINGKLRAVDSIEFTPHNVVTVDLLPEYPMTIAIMAKDNADPKTGMEYGDHIGDGGFIIKFADGTVSNAQWKAKNFFKGPLNHDTKSPVVEHTPIPDKWWTADFDDSKWPNAVEYTEERVNPKEPYYNADFAGARFIWSEDLDLDNTVIFRTKVEKPGWKPRWNTKPDLDVSGAPFK